LPCYGTRLEDICPVLNLFTYKIKIIALLWELVFQNYCPIMGKAFEDICPALNLFTYKIKVLALLKYNNIKFLKLGLALLAAIVSYAALWSYRYRPHIAPMSIDARLAMWWRVAGPVTLNNFRPATPIYTYLSNPISEFTNRF
jgi:hypothetical protein